jgi:MFS family permease
VSTQPASSAHAGRAASEDGRSTRALVRLLIAVTMVAGIVSSLGAPLIPAVARSLHVSLASAQWSLTVALLAGAISAPTVGRLGDGRYRREAIIGSLLVVLLGSLIAGFANSLAVLIVGRAMQGVGLGLAPVTMAAARDHLPAARSREVIAILSVAGAAGVGAGYPISGLIATDVSLHAAFFFGALLSGALVVASAIWIPSSRDSHGVSLDVRGVAILAVGLVALLIAIAQGEEWGWGSARILGLFVAAAAILAGWTVSQLRREVALVDLRQLRHRAVLTADLAALVLGVALYMFLTLVTEFVQEPLSGGFGFGSSTLTAGLCLVPFSVTSILASRIAGAASRRLGTTVVLVGGTLVTASAGAFFALLHGALWEAFVSMGVLGVGFGYTFAAIPGLITQAVPERDTGSAMGLYQVIRSIGFSIGSALAASILAGDLVAGSGRPSEHGYVTAIWVGSAICVAAAIMPLLIARRAPVAAGALAPDARRALGVEDAELGAAGLVGVERPAVDEPSAGRSS